MPRNELTNWLEGTDRRSIGRANEVAALVVREPRRFPELIGFLWSDDPVVRMRAADAVEKISSQEPGLLEPFKDALLGLLLEAQQKELRWHLAQMIPRLPLTRNERRRAAEGLQRYLGDNSSIVKTFALQGLTELAQADHSLLPEIREILETAERAGTPAMRARARKLLKTPKR
jgi:HEAT repeat protein